MICIKTGWKRLENDIATWLCDYENDMVHFRNSYQAITGFPFDGFRSDAMLANETTLLAIEVEAG